MYRHTLSTLLIAALSVTNAHMRSPHDATSTSRRPNLSGTYVIDRSASDDPRKAVEEATASMRRRGRGRAQGRLDDALAAPDTVYIATRGDTVSLTTSARKQLTTVPGADARTFDGKRGKSAESSSAWQGDALVVRTTSGEFSRETRYALVGGGTELHVAVTMTSPRLASPISYALVYRRVSTS